MGERKVLTLKEAKKCYLCYLCKERSAIFLVQTFLGSNQAIVKKFNNLLSFYRYSIILCLG